MKPPLPPASGKVTLDGADHVVVFDFDTLCRIETRTGKGVLQIVQDMVGNTDSGSAIVRLQSILARTPLAFMGPFVAACVDLPNEAVKGWARSGQLYKAFPRLIQPFLTATEELVAGIAEDQEDSASPNPSEAAGSSASEPPHSSSSVSAPMTSPV